VMVYDWSVPTILVASREEVGKGSRCVLAIRARIYNQRME
jgi:hypothetical protein